MLHILPPQRETWKTMQTSESRPAKNWQMMRKAPIRKKFVTFCRGDSVKNQSEKLLLDKVPREKTYLLIKMFLILD